MGHGQSAVPQGVLKWNYTAPDFRPVVTGPVVGEDGTVYVALTRGASGRRVRSLWSDVEVHALVSGIKRVWRPDQRDMDWTAVLRLYPTVFGQRTALDLKDKWRNLVKSGLMPPMPKAS